MQAACWRRLIPLLVLLSGSSFTVLAQPAVPAPVSRMDQVERGMTARQVRDLLGPPAAIARQMYYQGMLEQWIYERPEAGRIDVAHRLGKASEVTAIRRAARPRP